MSTDLHLYKKGFESINLYNMPSQDVSKLRGASQFEMLTAYMKFAEDQIISAPKEDLATQPRNPFFQDIYKLALEDFKKHTNTIKQAIENGYQFIIDG